MPATNDPELQAIQAKLYEVRRARMRLLLEKFADMTEFAEAIGEPLTYVSRLVKLQKSGRKNLGEGKARKIEGKLGLPRGWLDQDTAEPEIPAKAWPFKFDRAIWDNLTHAERRKAEAMLLTIINGIESERELQKGTG